jgi:hypothetical protein
MRLVDVYDMTYAEFQIRLFAYKRMQVREWEKFRLVAYNALIAPYQDYKKLPKSMDKFMDLSGGKAKKHGVSEEQKQNFLEIYKQYLNTKQ